MADAPKRSRTFWLVVGCMGLLVLSVPCVGVVAAIAIPSFVNYTRRAKTTEARANVMAIAHGVTAFCAEEHAPGTGPLPDAVGPTPAVPGADRQMATFGGAWSQVGFAPSDPLYYSYSIERPDSATAHVVAEGDLDGDGVRSRYEIDCAYLTVTSCTCTDLIVTDELE